MKSATVVLIPKGGKDPELLANRRPIGLINSIAKVLESIVEEEAQEFLESNSFIQASQFGFRKRLSPTQQAVHLGESITKEDHPRGRVAVAPLNSNKACYRVS